jgi:heat shock protein HslJ
MNLTSFRPSSTLTAAGAVALLALAAAGCGGADETGPAPPILAADTVVLPTAPTPAELADATYEGIFDRPVTLTAGRWEGEPPVEGASSRPSVGLMDHFSLHGDLDGDGALETAALLWSSTGGSGTRNYLAVVARTADGLRNRATTLLGDRVQVRSGRVEGREIVLDLVRHGPQDPACCPTERAEMRWVLDGGTLVVTTDEIVGPLSLADLEGPEWRLLTLGWNQPVPEGLEITLEIEADRVSGSSGCNRYTGGIAASDPGRLEISETAATKRACPEPVMSLESRFLRALAGASDYDFLAGRLALTCSTDEGMTTLIFEPSTAAE